MEKFTFFWSGTNWLGETFTKVREKILEEEKITSK